MWKEAEGTATGSVGGTGTRGVITIGPMKIAWGEDSLTAHYAFKSFPTTFSAAPLLYIENYYYYGVIQGDIVSGDLRNPQISSVSTTGFSIRTSAGNRPAENTTAYVKWTAYGSA